MENNFFTVIPIAVVLINQIALFAKHSIDKRRPIWRSLVDFTAEQPALLAFAVAIAATSLAADGGLNSSFLVFGLAIVWLSTNQLFKDSVKRRYRDYAWTALIAAVASYALSYNYWRDSVEWFFEVPSNQEATRYLIAFAVVAVIGSILIARTQRKTMKKLPTSRQLRRTYRMTILLPALLGVGISLLQSETRNQFLTQRAYTMLMFAAIIVAGGWAYWQVYRRAPARLVEEREHFLKGKKSRKRKSSKKKTKRK